MKKIKDKEPATKLPGKKDLVQKKGTKKEVKKDIRKSMKSKDDSGGSLWTKVGNFVKEAVDCCLE